VLETADANGWLAADVILAVERSSRGGEFTWPPGFVAERSRRYGETVLWFGRRAGATKEAVGT
jgi:16S rRNA (guanine966-N2)-methyltransferase